MLPNKGSLKKKISDLKCANKANNISIFQKNQLILMQKKLNFVKIKKTRQKNKIGCHFWLILSGAVIGFLNGFFGGGGGMVCVPILEKVLHLDSKRSHATAIAVILPLSIISAFIYVINGYIESVSLLTVGLGFVLGGIVGAFALKFLPPKAIRIIFAIIMFIGGLKLIL